MRKSIFAFLFFHFSVCCFAQNVRMRDVFASMPDSLLTMVTTNNRLDCIDFIENNMQAKVKNRLDEYVELKQLTDDYLLFETSDMSRVEMKLLPKTDSTAIVCMAQTYKGPAADSSIRFFMQDWTPASVLSCASRPMIEQFFPFVPESLKETMQGALLELKDLPMIEASLSATDNTLTWTISLDELSRDVKKVAQQCVQPLVVRLKED